MEENSSNQIVYTVEELSKILKISLSLTYQLVRSDGFPKIKVNKRILIPDTELRLWISNNCRAT